MSPTRLGGKRETIIKTAVKTATILDTYYIGLGTLLYIIVKLITTLERSHT